MTEEQIKTIIAAVIDELRKNPPDIDLEQLADEVQSRLDPIIVQTYDQSTNMLEEKSYPYPGPIKIQYYRIDVDEIAGKVADKLND